MTLGPQEYNSAKPQAVVVVLPQKEVTVDLGEPFAGHASSTSRAAATTWTPR